MGFDLGRVCGGSLARPCTHGMQAAVFAALAGLVGAKNDATAGLWRNVGNPRISAVRLRVAQAQLAVALNTDRITAAALPPFCDAIHGHRPPRRSWPWAAPPPPGPVSASAKRCSGEEPAALLARRPHARAGEEAAASRPAAGQGRGVGPRLPLLRGGLCGAVQDADAGARGHRRCHPCRAARLVLERGGALLCSGVATHGALLHGLHLVAAVLHAGVRGGLLRRVARTGLGRLDGPPSSSSELPPAAAATMNDVVLVHTLELLDEMTKMRESMVRLPSCSGGWPYLFAFFSQT
jgi:hypothetical protein